MSTFILRTSEPARAGLRLAVKDNIDVRGLPTTAGSKAVACNALPAAADASCVASAKASGAVVVGKTNLHELALGPTGINPWFGTPQNPQGAMLIPGGSSSGSAVAVAEEEADVGLGTDTGGSIRIPAACCGIVGLKPTYGRVSMQGVLPLARSLDAVGVLARNVRDAEKGMQLLDPSFSIVEVPEIRVGRVRPEGHPVVEQAIDSALRIAELDIRPVKLSTWPSAYEATLLISFSESAQEYSKLLHGEIPLGEDVSNALREGLAIGRESIRWAMQTRDRLKREFAAIFRQVDVIATSTISIPPPFLKDACRRSLTMNTRQVNLAGLPAVALPVPMKDSWASLQFIGPAYSEGLLLAVAKRVEAAVGIAAR